MPQFVDPKPSNVNRANYSQQELALANVIDAIQTLFDTNMAQTLQHLILAKCNARAHQSTFTRLAHRPRPEPVVRFCVAMTREVLRGPRTSILISQTFTSARRRRSRVTRITVGGTSRGEHLLQFLAQTVARQVKEQAQKLDIDAKGGLRPKTIIRRSQGRAANCM